MLHSSDLHIYFIGIGGMGMCGIAEVLHNMGYTVSGSDLAQTENTEHLAGLGITIFDSHDASHVTNVDVVVVTSAIRGYNSETEAARALKIPVIPRAEMLSELMRMKYSINVAGAHGKTTTAAMISAALLENNLDPTVVIGGRVNALGMTNSRLGQSDYLVAESDESDGSFLKLHPTIAVITNIDIEHLDHYGSIDKIQQSFLHVINQVPFYGLAVLCIDNPKVKELLPHIEKHYVTYGIDIDADYRACNLRYQEMSTRYIAWHKNNELGEICLTLPGLHNAQNSLAALAVCDFLKLPFSKHIQAMAHFQGIQRRFTVRGVINNVTVIDDFAHHPTEIQATLLSARLGFSSHRIIAAFQPHRFTRTRDQFHELATSFSNADIVLISDVFSAGEKPIEGADSKHLVEAITKNNHPHVVYISDREKIASTIHKLSQPNDLIITMGAGNIQKTCDELLTLL